MSIDGLAFVGRSRFGYGLDAEALVRSMDEAGIVHAIAAPMHRIDHDFRAGLTELASIAASSSGRLSWLARIDPWDGPDAVAAFSTAVTENGARGLFLHPAEEHFRINDPMLKPLSARAAALGVPIVVATGYQGMSEPVQITHFAAWSPDIPVVLTNGGQFNISGLAQIDANLALQLDNVYVHTSGVYRDDWIALVVSTFGADRILFASAAPVMNLRYELRRVELAHVPDEAKASMLAANAARLFGLAETA
jgi:predicted TIM-barrel fold metal-dependent hydrolase